MSGVRKESRNDSVAGSSTMMEPTMMEEGEEYFNTEEPSAEWTEPTACSQLCRMCATENEYLIPIFDGEGVEHQLGMKIEKHLPIRVHVDDTLPLQVCYQCASTLIAWHDLVVGCIEAEKKLRQLQHQGEPQEEDIEDVKTCDTAMFYEDPTGTEPANDPIDTEPSTSASTHVQIRLPPKKTVPKANPKLKMVIVKTPTPATVTAPTARMVTPKTEGALDTTERQDVGRGSGATTEITPPTNTRFFRTYTRSTIRSKKPPLPEYIDPTQKRSDEVSAVPNVDPLAVPDDALCKTPPTSTADLHCLDSPLPQGGTKRNANSDASERVARGNNKTITLVSGGTKYLLVPATRSGPCNRPYFRQKSRSREMATPKLTEVPEAATLKSIAQVQLSNSDRAGLGKAGVEKTATSNVSADNAVEATSNVPADNAVETPGKPDGGSTGLGAEAGPSTEKQLRVVELRTDVKVDQRSAEKREIHRCVSCNRSFRSKKSFESHVANKHRDSSYVCNVCKRQFMSVACFRKHFFRLHLKRAPKMHLCETCGKSYESTAFFGHRLVHLPEVASQFTCDTCGRSFKRRYALMEHMRAHTGERPYACAVCKKTFATRGPLRIHLRTHTKGQRFTCIVCAKAFGRADHLTTHMRIHTGLTPYQCELCDEQFMYYNERVQHKMKLHGVAKADAGIKEKPC